MQKITGAKRFLINLNDFSKVFGLKEAPNEVFQVSWKISAQSSSDFLHEVTGAYKFDFDWNDFLAKKSCCGVFVPKGLQNWLKMRSVRYHQQSLHETFPIFFMKLHKHQELRLTYMIFWENLCFDVFWL